jgi:hypothetical protein
VAQEAVQMQIERWAEMPLAQRAQATGASLLALLDAPLSIVEDPIFHNLANAFVDIGREDPQFRFGPGGCTLSRYRSRKAILDESSALSAMIVKSFASRPCVSLAIDAGTIARRHFLDIMILAPYSRLLPFLYISLENDHLTSANYGILVRQVIEELRSMGIKVRSIVGDNLPAQVSALAHWSTKSHLRGSDPFLNGIKYSPCLCP